MGRVEGRTLVSSMTAQMRPVSSMAFRRLSRVSRWYSWEPCEKFKRTSHMPTRRTSRRSAKPNLRCRWSWSWVSAAISPSALLRRIPRPAMPPGGTLSPRVGALVDWSGGATTRGRATVDAKQMGWGGPDPKEAVYMMKGRGSGPRRGPSK